MCSGKKIKIKGKLHSQPSVSTVLHPKSCLIQTWIKKKKTLRKVPNSKTWICHTPATISYIYVVLGTVSNLEMCQVICKDCIHHSMWQFWASVDSGIHRDPGTNPQQTPRHSLYNFSLDLCQFIGEGNGNPLKYSCLENSMDGGIW